MSRSLERQRPEHRGRRARTGPIACGLLLLSSTAPVVRAAAQPAAATPGRAAEPAPAAPALPAAEPGRAAEPAPAAPALLAAAPVRAAEPAPAAPALPAAEPGRAAEPAAAVPTLPAAEPAPAAARPPPPRPLRWGVGLELSPFTAPSAHTGIPAGAARLPVALTLRRELGRHTALSLGVGGPAASLGLSAWAGLEVYATALSIHRGLVELDLYATPGALLGFAGPDFVARHSDAFPGFPYIYSGPGTFATRLPLGVRLRLLHHRLDLYSEAIATLTFTPAVELLTGVNLGLRVSF